LRGVFVTGTDTEAGKSVVAACVCAALAARGKPVAVFKPVVTGMDEEAGELGYDHELLASAANAGQRPEDVAPYRFGPPVSPHLAAELAGTVIEPAELVAAARGQARAASGEGDGEAVLVCEGVGGLLVPITPGYLVRDLAIELGLPVVIAARTGLGTINHTLLTIEAARAAGLTVVGVVMTPWPDAPEPIELSNRATVERLGRAPVSGLPPTDPGSLASAGSHLPLDEWLPWSG
jgi:dethiobiotin synthetase